MLFRGTNWTQPPGDSSEEEAEGANDAGEEGEEEEDGDASDLWPESDAESGDA